MSGLGHLQIEAGLSDPFAMGSFPRLQYVLKGIKREKRTAVKPRLPITPQILMCLRELWLKQGGNADHVMLWAVCTLAFFGCFRSGELTVQSEASFDPSTHLTVADVTVDSHGTPSILHVRIKKSKTDPFRLGVMVYVGRVNSPLCPVSPVLAYLAVRPEGQGPLFKFANGRPLSRQSLVIKCTAAADPTAYSGHSFRVGTATAAHNAGMEDSCIRLLGRWESDAMLRCIRTRPVALVAMSQRLATGHSR